MLKSDVRVNMILLTLTSDNVTVDGDIIAEDIIADTVSANLIGDVTGSANTVRDAVQSNIKELGQLTKLVTNDNAKKSGVRVKLIY